MTYEEICSRLSALYETGEAKAIARWVLDVGFGLSMADILCGKVAALPQQELKAIVRRLEQGEPVQYVLGLADFCGRQFHVEPGVLIPRPETEELCGWMIETGIGGAVLDVGTGSGCIACTLAAAQPEAKVTAWDISETALRVASENARRCHVHVTFERVDALQAPLTSLQDLREAPEAGKRTSSNAHLWDTIVSNPPYICERERSAMERNVLEHEPHTALFVPDDDPLLFYRAISDYALQALRPEGALFFEINPLYAEQLRQHLEEKGFCVEQRKDQFGKIRFTKAIRP